MLLVDTREGKIFYDEELKAKLAGEFPYGQWIKQNMVNLEEIETGHQLKPLKWVRFMINILFPSIIPSKILTR